MTSHPLSDEVTYYLTETGIPIPDAAPLVRTPEPIDMPGARFDMDRVDRVVNQVFPRLQHTQGKWAGRALIPDPWQIAYILAPTYGWVRQNEDGDWVRIIRTQYIDVPRKNGKTTLAGAQALYLIGADNEAGAQVFAAAVAKDQARYCFDPVKLLADGSPKLRGKFKTTINRVVHTGSGSFFTVVSSIADLLHGANVHGAIVDELHKHKNRDLVEALKTGTGARTQPLIIIITTADDGKPDTIYAETRKYCEDLAAGTIIDPTFYGCVWAADKDDDPHDEKTWKKANPGYGVSPTREFMERASTEAVASPAALSSFLRLHLGVRTKQEVKYLELDVWDRNASMVMEEQLRGRECYGGLDLATTTDLTALCWDFAGDDSTHDLLWRCWIPERAFDKLNDRTAGNAAVWRRNGFLTVTDGDVLDYDFVRAQINTDREKFSVKEIGYDPWNSSQLVTDLANDGATLVPVRAGWASMTGPTKELLKLLLEGTSERPVYRHGGNPVARWCCDNFSVAYDPAGNVKPNKAVAADRIDLIVAAIIALDRSMRRKPRRRSAYEDPETDVG